MSDRADGGTRRPSTDPAAIFPGAARLSDLSLEEAIAAADRDLLRITADAAERERLEILARFPIDAWPAMPVEQYALGQPDHPDTFCRWMEFNTRYLPSIKGGAALKHLIYRRQTGDWYFERKYGSLEEAWRSVRGGFVDAFRLAGEGRFEEIGQLTGISAAVSLSTKALFCYFPDDLLPACAGAHQEHFWTLLGGQGPITKGAARCAPPAGARPNDPGLRRVAAQRGHVVPVRMGGPTAGSEDREGGTRTGREIVGRLRSQRLHSRRLGRDG